jgi:hypothetical protein
MTTLPHRLTPVLVATALWLFGTARTGAQCAVCRLALASPEGQQLVAAFRSGILLLLAAPVAAFAAVAFLAIRRQRRRERHRSGTSFAPCGDTRA